MAQRARCERAQDRRGLTSVDWLSALITVVFFALAAWFCFGPAPLDEVARETIAIPISSLQNIDATKVQVRPARPILSDPPIIHINGFERECQSCHRFFDSQPETARRLTQHTHIVLDHGLNDRCFNCHDRDNRNLLVLYSTQTIGYDEVERLCAKCHGPTYRDWQSGVHGRTDGYWDTSRGEAHQLVCTECHDPHAPAFPGYRPLSAPYTLRLDLSKEKHEGDVERTRANINPLRRWEQDVTRPHPPIRSDDNEDASDLYDEDNGESHETSDPNGTSNEDESSSDQAGGDG